MSDRAPLSRDQLLELLQQTEQQHATVLSAKDAELQTQEAQLQTKDDIIAQLEQKNQEWELAYNKLWHERFNARSERYIADADQLRLDFGDTDEAADAADGLADAVDEADLIPAHKRRKPRKRRNEGLPAHLPRYEVIAPVPDEIKNCPTHGQRTLLPESMWDRTESLESEPPQLKVRVTVYQKFACDNQPQCGIVSPERPTGIVEGNKYDASVAAEIITGKFGYHMPIYRQQDYFAGSRLRNQHECARLTQFRRQRATLPDAAVSIQD